jgi:hypothetical protein
MTDRETLLEQLRSANPLPDDDCVDAEELGLFVSYFAERKGDMHPTPMRQPTERSERQLRSWYRRPMVAVAAAAAVTLLAMTPLVMLRSGGADEPIDESVVSATTTPSSATSVPGERSTTTTSGALQSSPIPAMTWERLPHRGIFDDAFITSIVAGGPGLVAGGGVGDLQGDRAAVFVSADGIMWERIDSSSFAVAELGITHLAAGRDSALVAFGCGGDTQPLWVSQNGLEWERISTDIFGPGCRIGVQSVISGGPGFVAVGNTVEGNAAVWLSADGYKWTAVEDDDLVAGDADERNLFMRDVTIGGPGLVAVGGSGVANMDITTNPKFEGLAVWVSEDGSDWERLANLNDNWVASAWSDPTGDRIIAFGSHMWTSVDGYVWTRHEQENPASQLGWGSLAWDGDRVVAGGGDGWRVTLGVSNDRGDTWSRVDTEIPTFDGYNPSISDLVKFGDAFVAVGSTGEYMQDVVAIWIGTWDVER